MRPVPARAPRPPPHVPAQRPLRLRRPLLVALVALAGVYFVLSADVTLGAILFTGGQVLAALVTLGAMLVYRPANATGWTMVGTGLALVALGTAISMGLPAFGGTLPYPSVADACYVGGYMIAIVGVVKLLATALPDRATAALLDSLIVTLAVGLVSWTFVIQPLVLAEAMPLDVLVVSLAYPLLDVLALGLLAGLVLAPGIKLASLWLIALALAANTASDVGLVFQNAAGGYVPGSIVDLGWWVAVGFWVAAATHPTMGRLIVPLPEEGRGLAGRGRLLFLTSAALVPPALLVFQHLSATDPEAHQLIVVGSALMTLLVVVRLTLMMADLRRSVDARASVERELDHRALHDALTDLPNRIRFAERLDALLDEGPDQVAVLFCDLDDFKVINDTLGHPVGDALLRAVASRIASAVRPGDLAARLGGDEFAILIAGIRRPAPALRAAHRILAALADPFEVEGHDIAIHASIGIALSHGRTQDALQLMRDADIAMYLAKGRGKGRAELYRPAMHDDVVRRLMLRGDLEMAISDGQFSLSYQPIFDVASGEIEGVEALVRWDHPVLGRLQPSDFIGIAESSG